MMLTAGDRLFDGAWSIVKFACDRGRSGEPVRPTLAASVPESATLPDPRDFYAWIGFDEFAVYDVEDEHGDEPEMLFPIPTPSVGDEMTLFHDGTARDSSECNRNSPISPDDTPGGDARPEGRLPPLPKPGNGPLKMRIVHPTPEQAAVGLARLRRCMRVWRGEQALIIAKPTGLLFATLTQVVHHSRGFRMVFAVDEVLDAPTDFDAREPFELACGWNQPYMSFGPSEVHASFCFTVYFGSEGVSRARNVWAACPPGERIMPGMLRCCFSSPWEDVLKKARPFTRENVRHEVWKAKTRARMRRRESQRRRESLQQLKPSP